MSALGPDPHRPVSAQGLPAVTINRPLARRRAILAPVIGLLAVLVLVELALLLGPKLGMLIQPDAEWTSWSALSNPARNWAVANFGFYPLADSGLGQAAAALAEGLFALPHGAWQALAGAMTRAHPEQDPAVCAWLLEVSARGGGSVRALWQEYHCDIAAEYLATQDRERAAPMPNITRAFSAQLLHDGPAHLAMNALGLILLMPFVALRLGGLRLALFILLSAAGAMAGSALWSGGVLSQNVPVIGASGIVFALLGAHLRLGLARAKRRGDARPVLRLALVMIGLNVIFLAFNLGVAGDAHLGGMATGALILPLLMPSAPAHRSRLTRLRR